MKTGLQTAIWLGVLATGSVVTQTNAQNLVQTLAINLTAYDQPTATTMKTVRITTRDVINFFLQTNVPGARLVLVTPSGNEPGTAGNLNAFLRVMSGNTIIMEVPSPDSFNLFQDAAAVQTHPGGTRTATHAVNRFSIDFGALHAELQGFSPWSISHKAVDGVDVSGAGSFVSSVSGTGTVDGLTQSGVPMRGTISAGPPKPE